jgi:hypothetical protein
MTYYGLVSLRPKGKEERRSVKNALETKYQAKVKPVPRSLRKEVIAESLCDFYYKSNELIWLVEFPSKKEYNKLALSTETQINTVNTFDENETPKFLSKMKG